MAKIKSQSKSQTQQFFRKWPVWGLPAFAGIFAPWQDKLTSMTLISDYFQPDLSISGSILGPLACLSTYALIQKKSQKAVRKVLVFSISIFFLSIFACIFLRNTIDVTVFPDPKYQDLIRLSWISFYLMVFASLGASMTSAGVAIQKQDGSKS